MVADDADRHGGGAAGDPGLQPVELVKPAAAAAAHRVPSAAVGFTTTPVGVTLSPVGVALARERLALTIVGFAVAVWFRIWLPVPFGIAVTFRLGVGFALAFAVIVRRRLRLPQSVTVERLPDPELETVATPYETACRRCPGAAKMQPCM